ncbi:FAD-dependent oxidoreductase [Deinococcus lacus]|uniref:FAD-dependent oxidoreductase n=1 Tax=Deinococcus lacus TaxID=392561 RepID=A0ABW1YDD5_9DEIO
MSGAVWAHVGQPFEERAFDTVILGAGRMGTAAADWLRRTRPEQSLLLVEEGGLPNEEGATLLAAGLWEAPAQATDLAQRTLDCLEELGERAGWQPGVPLLTLETVPGPQSFPTAEALERWPELRGVIDPALWPWVRAQEAGLYRPGALALALGQRAVQAGAGLMLNTRAALVPGGVQLSRLTVTNTHEVVVHEVHQVQAGQVIVALGASGPQHAEESLGLHTRHGRAYVQRPRLNAPLTEQSPALRVPGLLLRPQSGGYTLYPAPRAADPHGYVPVPGRLSGVPVGLRREVLETLLTHMEGLPALASSALEVGRSLSDVPGTWVALPSGQPGHPPVLERLSPSVSLLLGGEQADVLGVGVAQQL